MERKPTSIAEIKQAALVLFAGNTRLSTWDAVEEVLDGMSDAELERIYRREMARYPWCARALEQGGDFLVSIAVERIATSMRQDPRILSADRRRTLAPARPRQPSGGRASGRARRPPRRRRPR
jgi:hypothetical protein